MKKIKLLFILTAFPLLTFAQWTVNEHLYSQSMTATCAIYDAITDAVVNNSNLQVVAMNGSTCCGAEMPTTLTIGGQQKNLYFLTIYGEANDHFQICVWDISQQKFLYKSSTIDFVMNNSMGTPNSPYQVSDGYSVCFNANGGVGEMPCLKFVNEEPQTLPANVFQNAGLVFNGWSTNTSGLVQYQDNDSFTASSDVTLYAQWRSNEVDITATAAPGGTITPLGTAAYTVGSNVTFTITSDNNYAVSDVVVDGISVGAVSTYTFPNVSQNHTIEAYFVLNGYFVTATAGMGGQISPAGETFVAAGQSVTYNIVPNNHYVVQDVMVDGNSIGAVNTYTFSNVAANHMISANFEFLWNVTPSDYEQNMNVFGQLQIDGVPQYDTNDVVAAFDGQECVGVGHPMYIQQLNRYLIFLTVFGNADQHPLTFKVYDASEDIIYDQVFLYDANNIALHLSFQGGAVHGSVSSPIIVNAKNYVEQVIHTVGGWNWISVNVNSPDEPLLEQFETTIENHGIQLKSQADGYYQYYSGTWFGNLTSMNNEQGYLLNNSGPADLSFVGILTEPSELPISLSPGWNWIGYTPNIPQSPADALSNLTPADMDIIKGQSNFSQYVAGLGWLGSLNLMRPGNGYMYMSNNSAITSFTYANTAVRNSVENTASTHWQNHPESYPTNMTVTAAVTINGQEIQSENYEIAAFCGNECRGTSRLVFEPRLGRYIAYITVNGSGNESIDFKLYDEQNFNVFVSSGTTIRFITDEVIGNPTNPYVLDFVPSPNGIDAYDATQVLVYPNPATDYVTVSSSVPVVKVEVFDAVGKLVMHQELSADQRVGVSQLTPGVYLMKIYTANKAVQYQKIVIE